MKQTENNSSNTMGSVDATADDVVVAVAIATAVDVQCIHFSRTFPWKIAYTLTRTYTTATAA